MNAIESIIAKFKEDWLETAFAVSLLACALTMPALVLIGFAAFLVY